MALNRKRLIGLFIGNVSNAILHKILEKAVEDDAVRKYYDKEFLNSFDIARKYRAKINPTDRKLPEFSEIKKNIINKVINELELRTAKGYKNIDLSSVESVTDNILSELKVDDE